MQVPAKLASAFGAPFEELIGRFAADQELIPEMAAVRSTRFLSRSVVPHVKKLSALFNRVSDEDGEIDQTRRLAPYWKESSNPAHLRLAYFLYFMPSNLYRVASVWAELARLGFEWKGGDQLRGIEIGAGPAVGACGIAAGERFAKAGIPQAGNWALIEQDKAMLQLGAEWAETYFRDCEVGDWGTRTFHRKIDLKESLLPKTAPRFNLWVMSYFLNEIWSDDSSKTARTLIEAWSRHLDDEGIVIIVEPALKLQSRRLLELRKAILEQKKRQELDWLQVLLPCLGHQACHALANPEDWCHEDVSWFRPPYFRIIDKLAGLDRKTLPFSYLVLTRSRKPIEEILPSLAVPAKTPGGRYRLVSPSHSEGRDAEFFICGQDGKRRARYRPEEGQEKPDRGTILIGAEVRGDAQATRVERIFRAVP